ncbi:MAG TPA: class I adenylate-forming enzyme family protein [Gemmataceae bacterium]
MNEIYQIPWQNIGDLLRRQTETYRDKPWLIFYCDASGRHELSYRQFYERVARTSNYLLARGVAKGDRIATVTHNHADTVVHYWAAWTLGAVVVPINLGEDDRRIGHILKKSGAKLALVREPYVPRIEAIVAAAPSVEAIVRVGTAEDDSLERFAGQLDSLPAVGADDEALIVYTSGTTGLPKGVVLTQRNLLVDAHAIAQWHRMTPDQRMMCVLPLHHVNGTVVTLMTPMVYGGSVVLNQKFHSERFFERVAAEKVHVASVVPTLLRFLLHANIDVSCHDLRHFRHLICGAGPLSVELALKFEDRFGIPIIHGYGLSETTCYSCFLPLDLTSQEHYRWLSEYGFPSIGVPIPPNEMAIRDDRGHELPEGARGEIVVRGANVMKEYYAEPEANRAAFSHGWFRSGDEGFYRTDSQGRRFFFISGRIKELIIRGGINISPFEIDEVLLRIPGVKAGLAIAFENDWYGEEIGAYVQMLDGNSLTEAEVIAHCRKHFVYAKCPKVVIFGDDVPITSTGKYQRNKLKSLFEKWKGVQFKE